jgi:hypothetical protein
MEQYFEWLERSCIKGLLFRVGFISYAEGCGIFGGKREPVKSDMSAPFKNILHRR